MGPTHSWTDGVNWAKAQDVGLGLLISPLVGFCVAALLLLLCKSLVKNPSLYKAPEGKTPPPVWIRGILMLTCTGVSFAHGSNDGQKGMGLIVLIRIRAPNLIIVKKAIVLDRFQTPGYRACATLIFCDTPAPRLSVEPRIFYNPRMKSPIYMVPGVAAITLLVVTTIITAMGLAREKEMGTIEQLMITPMRPAVLLLGKTLPFALIGLIVGGLVIAIGTHLFAVPLRGSLLCIFLGMVLYLLSTLGTGVFISTVARNQQQAILAGFFFLMPAILLSGFMSPVENMPGWIQPLTWVNPVRYFVEILRAALLKGAGVLDMTRQLLALAAFGAGILGLAALRFRKQLG
jgi:ABC-2 type transport system permease protein